MTISQYSALSIPTIICYAILLPFSLLALKRHGFSRSGAWFYIPLHALVRIAGSACQIADDQHPSIALRITVLTMSYFGLVPLLLVLFGMLSRIHRHMQASSSTSLLERIFRICRIVSLVALILAVIAAVKTSDVTNVSSVSLATSLRKAASILLLSLFAILAAVALKFLLSLQQGRITAADRFLILAAVAVIPFLTVRFIELELAAFSTMSAFHSLPVNVYVQAFMVFLMELATASTFVAAGLKTPKETKDVQSDTETTVQYPKGQTTGTV